MDHNVFNKHYIFIFLLVKLCFGSFLFFLGNSLELFYILFYHLEYKFARIYQTLLPKNLVWGIEHAAINYSIVSLIY